MTKKLKRVNQKVEDKPEVVNGRFQVSQSKVNTYLRCPRAYHYKYVERLRKKRTKRALTFGRLMHSILEVDANGLDWVDFLREFADANAKLLIAEQEEYGNIIQDMLWIMTDYFRYWEEKKEDLIYLKIDDRKAEHKFKIELVDGIDWTGIIDGVARSKRLRWLADHKSFSRRPNEDDLWRNLQSSTYTRAIDILGWKPVDGMVWDFINSKPPTQISFNQDGSVSKRGINSLPSVLDDYEEALEQENDPKSGLDLSGMRKSLETNRQNYYFRIYVPTQKNVVTRVMEDFTTTAVEMSELHGKRKQRNIGRHCSWCDFEPLCRAALQNSDVDFVKSKEYRTDEQIESENLETTDEEG